MLSYEVNITAGSESSENTGPKACGENSDRFKRFKETDSKGREEYSAPAESAFLHVVS